MLSEFQQKLLLLGVGAALTGILVPYIKSRMDSSSAKETLRAEALLKRQAEVIDAQIQFLAQFSDQVWEFLFAAFRVSYAKAWENDDMQAQVCKEYESASWNGLSKIRGTISRGSRLLESELEKELGDFYYWLLQYDDQICDAVDGRAVVDWPTFHRGHFHEASAKADVAINKLATAMKIAVKA